MIIQVNPIEEVLKRWNLILSGFIVTMWLYLWALIIGFFLGLLLAILRVYGKTFRPPYTAPLSWFASGYIEIIRGTPLLAQIFFFYFLPLSLNIPLGDWKLETVVSLFGKDISVIWLNQRTLIAILTLGLNSAAYQAEYFRGAIISISSEQLITAQSLGMSRGDGIRRVILPQALRRVIPAWSNEAAYLPKYTVVVYFIAVSDLFARAYAVAFATFAVIFTYIIVAILFLIVITLVSKALDILLDLL